jgi:hypothetical protein
MMKFPSSAVALWFVFLIVGCAATSVTRQTPMVAQGLPRPNQIWVYNFIANPADMPANSSIAAAMSAPSTRPTPDEVEQGRQLGALIA